MFPHQIKSIALVSIKHREWNTLKHLVSELGNWMVSPDIQTADAAGQIGEAIMNSPDYQTSPELVNIVHSLLKYAVDTYNELLQKRAAPSMDK